jgi:hypothetical protein
MKVFLEIMKKFALFFIVFAVPHLGVFFGILWVTPWGIDGGFMGCVVVWFLGTLSGMSILDNLKIKDYIEDLMGLTWMGHFMVAFGIFILTSPSIGREAWPSAMIAFCGAIGLYHLGIGCSMDQRRNACLE